MANKRLELVGKRFGMLVVLKEAGITKSRNVAWLCKCDCGNEKIIRGGNLVSGTTKSCGCSGKTNIKLNGIRFGRLLVLKKVGTSKYGSQIWLCRCDCGNEKRTTTNKLTSGCVKSCGCLSTKLNLKGKKFNRLLVLDEYGTDDYKNVTWLCKCDCGNEHVVSSALLVSGNTKSCGCLNDELKRQRKGKNHYNFGKKASVETRNKMSVTHLGKHITKDNKGKKNPNYKGGVKELNIPLYDTYAYQLRKFSFEETRIHMLLIDGVVYKSLQVRCNESGCRRWFTPRQIQVSNRLQSFNGTTNGSNNFYCSEECKINCSTYRKQVKFKNQKDIKRTYSKAELKEWSREVLRRANFTCVVCGEQANTGHHLRSKIEYPEFALDPTMGAATCRLCHYEVFHKGDNHSSHYVDKCRDLRKPDKK